jgi:cytochrome c553
MLLLNHSAAWASADRADERIRATLQREGDAARGRKLYLEHCARCHYESAAGDPQNLVPKLAGQRRAYIIKQLADFVEAQRDGDEMHSVLAHPLLEEPKVWADVASYLSALPLTGATETGNGDSVMLGEGIYRKQCASCHGDAARGSADGFVPSLRDQHFSYLVWQMRSVAGARRLHVDADVAKALYGIDSEQIAAIADYLSRLPEPNAAGSLSGDSSGRK